MKNRLLSFIVSILFLSFIIVLYTSFGAFLSSCGTTTPDWNRTAHVSISCEGISPYFATATCFGNNVDIATAIQNYQYKIRLVVISNGDIIGYYDFRGSNQLSVTTFGGRSDGYYSGNEMIIKVPGNMSFTIQLRIQAYCTTNPQTDAYYWERNLSQVVNTGYTDWYGTTYLDFSPDYRYCEYLLN